MMMFSLISGLFVFAILGLLGAAVLVGLFLEKVPDGEQWVVTRFDQASLVGPGWRLRLPLVDQVMRLSSQPVATRVQDQLCTTKDPARVIVHLIVYSRVTDPLRYAAQVKNQRLDLSALASSTLKEIVSELLLDEVLSGREKLGELFCKRLNQKLVSTQALQIVSVQVNGVGASKETLAKLARSPAAGSGSCPSCGAPFHGDGIRGRKSITCAYCGFEIPLIVENNHAGIHSH